MRFRKFLPILFTFSATSTIPYAEAADSIQTALGASKHASQAVAMGLAASGQATLGVAAVPLLSVGAIGSVVGAGSTAVGNGFAAAATGKPSREPLPVTDETITAISPTDALKPRTGTAPR